MASLFLYNWDNEVMLELPGNNVCLRLDIKVGKRVTPPCNLFFGSMDNMLSFSTEEAAWEIVERDAVLCTA